MNKFISCFIFLLISSAVFVGAFYTLKKSVSEQSNIVLISKLIESSSSPVLAYINNRRSSSPPVTEANVGMAVLGQSEPSEIVCDPKISPTYSIINFLRDHNEDYSFEARTQIAINHKIENYTGSAEQNLLLIKLLYIEKHALCRV